MEIDIGRPAATFQHELASKAMMVNRVTAGARSNSNRFVAATFHGAGVHHTYRRCGCNMAARGARTAGSGAPGRCVAAQSEGGGDLRRAVPPLHGSDRLGRRTQSPFPVCL